MDREILLTGIGGQGVQLAAKILAHAGMIEGRHVMQFSMFQGTMRGGSSECTVVVADSEVEAPPVVPHAWAAVAMHPSALGQIEEKVRPGGAIVYNRSLIPEPPSRPDCRWIPLDASRIAIDMSYAQGQSLIALGGFASLTGIVKPESLDNALRELLPPYRHQTIQINSQCLTAGADAAAEVSGSYLAWNGS